VDFLGRSLLVYSRTPESMRVERSFKRFLEDFSFRLVLEQVSPNYYGARIQDKWYYALQWDNIVLTGWGTTEAKAVRHLLKHLNDYAYAYMRSNVVFLPSFDIEGICT